MVVSRVRKPAIGLALPGTVTATNKLSEKLLAAWVVSHRAHHGTVTDLPGPLGPRAGPGRSGHGVASHHGTHGLRGWGLSGRSNDVI